MIARRVGKLTERSYSQDHARVQTSPSSELPLKRWTVEDYHRMIGAGILTPDDRVELLDGQIVEMAHLTLQRDRTRKAKIYASAGILECWIVDLNQQQVIVLRDPQPNAYQSEQISAHRGSDCADRFLRGHS